MYCPKCGNNQTEERKFCTSCGTNLGAVTAALTHQLPVQRDAGVTSLAQAQARFQLQSAEAIHKGAPGAALILAAILVWIFMHNSGAMWIGFGLMMGGLTSLFKGIGLYSLARATLKVAEADLQTYALPYSQPVPLAAQNPTQTNPIPPPSITEQPTRHLN